MDLLQKDVPILTKIYKAKCFYDSQNNRIILYYKNHVTAQTLVDFYNLPITLSPSSFLYVIYDLRTRVFNVSTEPPIYTVSNSKVYITSPINAVYDMDKVIIYRISWYETDTDIPIFTPLSVPYSRLYIQSSAPTSPQLYDSWYNTDTNKLFYFNGSAWIKVDWTKWVQNDIWYQLGKLRINNGQLQVSNNGTNWYQVFPAIGRTVEVIADDTNSADNFKIVYLTIGQALLLRNKYRIRCACVNPSIWSGMLKHSLNSWIYGFKPSGVNISDGAIQILRATNIELGCAGYTGFSFVPLIEGTTVEADNWVEFNFIVLSQVYSSATGRAISTWPTGGVFTARGSFPGNGYFVGTMTNRIANIFVDYMVITRQG